MTLPGPPGALLAAALLGFALETAVVGECVRALAGRWVALWRGVDPIERFVLDLALGGAVVYGVAAVPLGLFGVPLLAGLPVIAAAGLAALWVRRRSVARAAIGRLASQLLRPAPLLVLATGLSVFAVELAPALGAATGNTFDSSLLTTYTALLIGHGSIPLSFHPYADPMILYPQGTTVWLGAAQLLLGLPAARTSVLVTPFFLALPPLSGFVLGRRMFGTDRGGVAVALVLGWLGPSTRSLVGGSNDFAVAFPFVLLVAAQSTVWMRDELPGWGDAVGFGVLVGYTAAINPVGAEWLIPAVLGIGLVGARRAVGDAVRWAGRWGAAVAASIVPVIPSLYVLVRGLGSPGYVPGAAGPPSPTPTGITWSQWVGSVDPFLFRPGDVALSPVPTLRAEIAVLLVLSAAALVLASGGSPLGAYLHRFRTWSLIAFASLVLWLLVLVAARSGVPGAVSVAPLSSGAEMSTWLFALYGLVGSVPLAVVLERIGRFPRPTVEPPPTVGRSDRSGPRSDGSRRRASVARAVVPLVAATIVLAPGIVLTPTQLPPVLSALYADFGNVSAGDFSLLACAGANLPDGSRVLVAPGSVAEFLPGYTRDITLLYPLIPGWPWVNSSYTTVVSELTNGTLGPPGEAAIVELRVGWVAVTERNSVLWPAFSPQPLLADPAGFTPVFHSGDAYLFSTHAGSPTLPCP